MKSITTMGKEDYTHDDMAALHEECQTNEIRVGIVTDGNIKVLYEGTNKGLAVELKSLREKLATAEQRAQIGATGLMYAEPALSMLWGLTQDQLDSEHQKHLYEALLQVRRSQRDLLNLAIIDGENK